MYTTYTSLLMLTRQRVVLGQYKLDAHASDSAWHVQSLARRARITKRRTASGVVTLIMILAVAGCGSEHPAADSEVKAAKERVAAIAAGSQSSAQATDTGGSVFNHPIDNIPEGKRFRAATRAIDGGDFKAAEQIRKELESHPQYSSLATAVTALILVKQGKHAEAIRLAEDISTVPVMRSEAYTIAGEVFQRENRWAEAISAFQNALDINPQHVRAHLWLGAIYYDTGAMRLATTHLRKAAELDPTDVNSLLLSAKINKDYEQYEEAIRDYRAMLDRAMTDDKRLLAQVKLAECLSEIRQLEAATEVLRSCPEVPAVIATRAAIAEAAGDFQTAARLARDTLRQVPGNLIAGMILGRISVTERNWEEAIRILGSLVKAFPHDHEPRLLYGRALVGFGDQERGQAEIHQATDLKDTFLKFAELHQEAIRKPNDTAIRVELGRLAERLGKTDLARTWYQAALGLEASNKEASDALNRLPKTSK